MSVLKFIEGDLITVDDLDQIEQLAQLNYGPTDIALNLGYKPADFKAIWNNPDGDVFIAYQRGRQVIETKKLKKLNKKIKGGSETAIQIHDKHTADREFQDIKAQIFGL